MAPRGWIVLTLIFAAVLVVGVFSTFNPPSAPIGSASPSSKSVLPAQGRSSSKRISGSGFDQRHHLPYYAGRDPDKPYDSLRVAHFCDSFSASRSNSPLIEQMKSSSLVCNKPALTDILAIRYDIDPASAFDTDSTRRLSASCVRREAAIIARINESVYARQRPEVDESDVASPLQPQLLCLRNAIDTVAVAFRVLMKSASEQAVATTSSADISTTDATTATSRNNTSDAENDSSSNGITTITTPSSSNSDFTQSSSGQKLQALSPAKKRVVVSFVTTRNNVDRPAETGTGDSDLSILVGSFLTHGVATRDELHLLVSCGTERDRIQSTLIDPIRIAMFRRRKRKLLRLRLEVINKKRKRMETPKSSPSAKRQSREAAAAEAAAVAPRVATEADSENEHSDKQDHQKHDQRMNSIGNLSAGERSKRDSDAANCDEAAAAGDEAAPGCAPASESASQEQQWRQQEEDAKMRISKMTIDELVAQVAAVQTSGWSVMPQPSNAQPGSNMRVWLFSHYIDHILPRQSVEVVLTCDSRDIIFQGPIFSAIADMNLNERYKADWRQQQKHAAASDQPWREKEFVFVVAEDPLLSLSHNAATKLALTRFLTPDVMADAFTRVDKNERGKILWNRQLAEEFQMWDSRPMPHASWLSMLRNSSADNRPVASISSGIIVGTPPALSAFYLLFKSILDCDGSVGADGAALVLMFLYGMQATGFFYPAYVLNPLVGPMRHAVPAAEQQIWPRSDARNGKLVNCIGEVYAVCHQCDRYAAEWRRYQEFGALLQREGQRDDDDDDNWGNTKKDKKNKAVDFGGPMEAAAPPEIGNPGRAMRRRPGGRLEQRPREQPIFKRVGE